MSEAIIEAELGSYFNDDTIALLETASPKEKGELVFRCRHDIKPTHMFDEHENHTDIILSVIRNPDHIRLIRDALNEILSKMVVEEA